MDSSNESDTRAEPTGRLALPAYAVVAAAVVLIGAVGAASYMAGRAGPSGAARGPAVLLSSRNGVASGARMSVTATGKVTGTPDTVSFDIGVDSTQPTATQALSHNASRIAAIEKSLEQHGVASKDMQTSNLSIYERQGAHGAFLGFEVDSQLDVTMHDVAEAGPAIDAAAHLAGTGIQFYGISFSISNRSALLRQARERAMENARSEASELAAGAGASLSGIERVTTHQSTIPTPVFAGDFAGAASPSSTSLSPGSKKVSVTVTVVYALRSS